MRCAAASVSAIVVFAACLAIAADGNRLAYLDGPLDPYYPHRDFPKLITPQWVGEEGVECVVTLAIVADVLGAPAARSCGREFAVLRRLRSRHGRTSGFHARGDRPRHVRLSLRRVRARGASRAWAGQGDDARGHGASGVVRRAARDAGDARCTRVVPSAWFRGHHRQHQSHGDRPARHLSPLISPHVSSGG